MKYTLPSGNASVELKDSGELILNYHVDQEVGDLLSEAMKELFIISNNVSGIHLKNEFGEI